MNGTTPEGSDIDLASQLQRQPLEEGAFATAFRRRFSLDDDGVRTCCLFRGRTGKGGGSAGEDDLEPTRIS